MSSNRTQETPEYQAKAAIRRKHRQKITKRSRKITRQKGQSRRPSLR